MIMIRMPTQTSSRLVEGRDPFVVELDSFQGPLDLLLHLIRSQDIDIFDIPIARITDQFLRAIEDVEQRLSLEKAGEFLELAATLVRVKSQMLLPHREDLEDDDPRSDLVRRLLEYEAFREVAYALSSAEADRARHLGKGFVPPRPTPDRSEGPLEVTLAELVEVALTLPAPPRRRPHRAPLRSVTVDEKIELWFNVLRETVRVTFDSFMNRWRSRMHAVMSFLACLELAKRGAVALRQERHFGTLWVYRGEDDTDR